MSEAAGEELKLELRVGEWVEVRVGRTDGSTTVLRIEAIATREPAPPEPPVTQRLEGAPPLPVAQPEIADEPTKVSKTVLAEPVVAAPVAPVAAIVPVASTNTEVEGASNQRSLWVLGVVALSMLAFFWARACAH